MKKIIILTSFFLAFLILSGKKENKYKTNTEVSNEIIVVDFDSKKIISGHIIPFPSK